MTEQTRRQFLKTAGLGALALAVPGSMAFAGSINYGGRRGDDIRRMIESAREEGMIYEGSIYHVPSGANFESYVSDLKSKGQFNNVAGVISPKSRTIFYLSDLFHVDSKYECNEKIQAQESFIRNIFSKDSNARIRFIDSGTQYEWGRKQLEEFLPLFQKNVIHCQ